MYVVTIYGGKSIKKTIFIKNLYRNNLYNTIIILLCKIPIKINITD